MRRLATLVFVILALPATAAAQQSDPNCLNTDPPPVTKPPHPIRFGITPGAAGSVGGGQANVVAEDDAKAMAALRDLRPGGRALVMRLNRLFWADGDEGIKRFAALTDKYASAGFQVESQVRYHPPEGKEGDIAAWVQYVRAVARELGRRPALSALSITNEGNFDGSKNTSDGAYEGVVDALVQGTVAAREELDAMGRQDVQLGFSMMWRWRPDGDRKFWEDIGAKGTPAFRAAVDYVGLQIYPGLVYPPAPQPGRSAGDEIVEALTLLRNCYMPKGKLGPEVSTWISENGYATNLGRSEESQVADLRSTLDVVSKWSGELGISDYRYFNLRDNDSDGSDLFAAVGLLRDDYSRKPAFATFGGAVAQLGADAPPLVPVPQPPTAPATPPRFDPSGLRVSIRRRGRRTLVVGGRVLGGRCTGRVRVKIGRKTRRVKVRRDCRFRLRAKVRGRARSVRVVVRRGRVAATRRVRLGRAR
ncbi:MAG TPA: hypothetical protein VF549_18975 [Solirubrobacteraceae bacterium]|jgi:hypothetical protein